VVSEFEDGARHNRVSNPTVSVILPVFNGEDYLRLAIDSVLNQTFQDYELIIIDDGSRDSTPAIVQGYSGRVRYVRQANTGVAGAFNHGLSLASGRYISWLSHDDVFLPRKLEDQVARLRDYSDPVVCYTDIQMIDSAGNVTGEHRLPEYSRGNILRHVLTAGPICSASYSILYDRRCIDEVGLYSESWRYTQDVDMLARLARRFAFVRVPNMLMQVREHGNRGIRSKAWQREVVKYFHKELSDIPLEELFPELCDGAAKSARAQAYVWLGDTLAGQPFPIYRVAASQYRRAMREEPARAGALLRKIAWVMRRYLRDDMRRAA